MTTPASPTTAPAASSPPRVGTVRGVGVAGLGYYLPRHRITNSDLAKLVDTSNEWIVERTGIRSRHRADEAEATSDLATHAAGAALQDAGVPASELDLILVATATPDSPVPATACLVQTRLGADRASAMDVNAGCSGFLYALHMAASFVSSGLHRNVLIIGAETLTRVTDYTDRRSCILFGDGAGAFVVRERGLFELIYTRTGCDGKMAQLIEIPGGGSRSPASAETIQERMHYLRLDGQKVFKQAVRRMAEAAREALDATGLSAEQIDWVIPHQANERILVSVAEQVGLPARRMVLDLAETGNTSAASVPITIGRARAEGRFRAGQFVMLLAFGAGLTWACQVLRLTQDLD